MAVEVVDKIRIEYINVGRGKFCGIISYPVTKNLSPDDIAELAYREAQKHLASKYIDTEYNAETNEGVISAGYRDVGKFKVVKGD